MARSVRWTSADLLALPQEEGKRYEIIDGELFVSKQPSWEHQLICFGIGVALDGWSRQTGAGVVNLAPGLIFAEDDDVAPDLVWVSAERLPTVLASDGKLHAAPELLVEVLSPGSANRRRDKGGQARPLRTPGSARVLDRGLAASPGRGLSTSGRGAPSGSHTDRDQRARISAAPRLQPPTP